MQEKIDDIGENNKDFVSFSEVDETGNFVDVYGYNEKNNVEEILKQMQEMKKNEKSEKEG